ncbi:MAG: right-handed parallel beta-helix repeat-containing protein [Thermoanaerobaculia bacterium]|nr:right-handed parallel beta-helix repeat-containing protein [Thermoanaerobaculia bacterium]
MSSFRSLQLSLAFLLLCTTATQADLPPWLGSADGWTEFTEVTSGPRTTRTIYVSSSQGSDSNDGLSSATPKATLAAGMSLVRDGYPDRLLLRRGDVWEDQRFSINRSGLSPEGPLRIASYGTAAARPIVRSGIESGVVFSFGEVTDFIAIQDIDFAAHRRDPAHPSYDPNVDYFDDNAGISATHSGGTFLLVEGCRFRWYSSGIVIQSFGAGLQSDVAIRRNVIIDSYGVSAFSQGLYAYRTQHLLIEENVFDVNGHLPAAGVEGSIFDHSVYLQNESVGPGTVVRGNIFSRGDGIQMREGGLAEDNLFIRTSALLCGSGNDPTSQGSSATCSATSSSRAPTSMERITAAGASWSTTPMPALP